MSACGVISGSTGLHAAVVMPDHVHILITPYEEFGLRRIMQRIKSVSAHRLRRGIVWQREYFDHLLRSDESLQAKAAYIIANPLRAGIVSDASGYRWSWLPNG